MKSSTSICSNNVVEKRNKPEKSNNPKNVMSSHTNGVAAHNVQASNISDDPFQTTSALSIISHKRTTTCIHHNQAKKIQSIEPKDRSASSLPTPKDCDAPTTCCHGCGTVFASRNAVFKHLKETNGACLQPCDYQDFVQYVKKTRKMEKILILYGYLPHVVSTPIHHLTGLQQVNSNVHSLNIRNGQDAGRILMETIQEWQNDVDGIVPEETINISTTNPDSFRLLNRSYGNTSKNIAKCVRQDLDTAATTEVMAVRLPPLMGNITEDEWINEIQARLDIKYQSVSSISSLTTTPLRCLGRLGMPHSKFNAELDVTHRRIEYVLPIDFLTWSITDQTFRTKVLQQLPVFGENHKHGLHHLNQAAAISILPPEEDLKRYMTNLKNIMKLLRTHIVADDSGATVDDAYDETKRVINNNKTAWNGGGSSKKKQRNQGRLLQRRTSKKKSKNIRTTSGEQLDQPSKKSADPQSRSLYCPSKEGKVINNNGNDCTVTTRDSMSASSKQQQQQHRQKHYLKRKRFHNFTETVMAHEYYAYRRLDRMYHRATLEFPDRYIDNNNNKETRNSRLHKYLILSLSGDLFLTGQVQRVVGVFLALANGLVDTDFCDCVFDEEYPHLIPTPEAPNIGMVAAEAHYVNMEGKTQLILSPRVSQQYPSGFNQQRTLVRVKNWQQDVYQHITKEWERRGREAEKEDSTSDRRLLVEKEWTETVLKPWAERARQQLEDYRSWKKSASGAAEGASAESIRSASNLATSDKQDERTNATDCSFPPNELLVDDFSVPKVFQKVLQCLREVDASGKWPTTTPKRQLVLVSSTSTENFVNHDNQQDGADHLHYQRADSLSIAHAKAKINSRERSSAYSFPEGQGGASGSFSVGYMPGGINKTPKANQLFPELVKAAFELEIALCPHREPSSTIAINRNAQFRPHTDSGAGAGQSTSLIVGVGTYSGGELVIEGTKQDIRYRSVEFNGWRERHWTMPFQGERYSLVWFTPKGCEGMRGIDL